MDLNETVEVKKHHLEELRFYGFAGICIIRFQQAEDYLQTPFTELLALSAGRSDIVFGAIRTISRRCKVIGQLIEAERPGLSNRWKDLAGRILRAEKCRDSIAHGSPVFGGGVTIIQMERSADRRQVVQGESFFYLKKRGFDDWTTERLLDEARRMETLLSDLYAFGRSLEASRAPNGTDPTTPSSP
jgi:hypothetical protein